MSFSIELISMLPLRRAFHLWVAGSYVYSTQGGIMGDGTLDTIAVLDIEGSGVSSARWSYKIL